MKVTLLVLVGAINNNVKKGKEEFNCSNCKLKIDRDVAGSRNILIKNIPTLGLTSVFAGFK